MKPHKMKIKPFKYKGTPEQIAKITGWLESNGVKETSGDGLVPKILFVDACVSGVGGFTYQTFGNFTSPSNFTSLCMFNADRNQEIPPEYELTIFGSTNKITGKVENPWVLHTASGQPPETFGKIVNFITEVESGTTLYDKYEYFPADANLLCWDVGDSGSVVKWRIHTTDEEYFKQPETAGQVNISDYENSVGEIVSKIEMENGSSIDFQPVTGDSSWKSYTGFPPIEDVPVKSDGGSSSYYKLTIKTRDGSFDCETGDVIAAMVGDNFALGNALKALRRIYENSQGRGKLGVDQSYDANKINYFVNDFIERSKW